MVTAAKVDEPGFLSFSDVRVFDLLYKAMRDLAQEANILIILLTILTDWLGTRHERKTLLASIAECVPEMRMLFPAPVDHVSKHAAVFAVTAPF